MSIGIVAYSIVGIITATAVTVAIGSEATEAPARGGDRTEMKRKLKAAQDAVEKAKLRPSMTISKTRRNTRNDRRVDQY